MQIELVQNRKEHNTTIKQLNEIVVQIDGKIKTTLPPAQSPEPVTKVFYTQHVLSVFQ